MFKSRFKGNEIKIILWSIFVELWDAQGRRKLFLVGGGLIQKLKFESPSRALQVRGFIGEIF